MTTAVQMVRRNAPAASISLESGTSPLYQHRGDALTLRNAD